MSTPIITADNIVPVITAVTGLIAAIISLFKSHSAQQSTDDLQLSVDAKHSESMAEIGAVRQQVTGTMDKMAEGLANSVPASALPLTQRPVATVMYPQGTLPSDANMGNIGPNNVTTTNG